MNLLIASSSRELLEARFMSVGHYLQITKAITGILYSHRREFFPGTGRHSGVCMISPNHQSL